MRRLFVWLKVNCKFFSSYSNITEWKSIFSSAIWFIWKNRNSIIFNGKLVCTNITVITNSQANEIANRVSKCMDSVIHHTIQIRWAPPHLGWTKLNPYGSTIGNSGPASCARVLRNYLGGWVGDFQRRLGTMNSLMTVIWAIRNGLLLTKI